MSTRPQPRYAHGPGCWRKDRFVKFHHRSKFGIRYDVWGITLGMTVPIAHDQVEGDTPMQRAMFIRREIDAVLSRITPYPAEGHEDRAERDGG